jgi:hypothetical protein
VVEGAARRGDGIVTSDPDDLSKVIPVTGVSLAVLSV